MSATTSRISELAEQFLQHGAGVRGWSPSTVATYRLSFRWCPEEITKPSLNRAVASMRERGLSVGGVNLRIRSLNSFLTWLHDEGHSRERFRIKLLKNPTRPVQTLTAEDVKLLWRFRPKGRIQVRAWTLAILLLDSGLRISEALGLLRANVDLANAFIRVRGKAGKERLVPLSIATRKHVVRLMRATSSRFMFHTFDGSRLGRHHAYRDLQNICARAGVRTKVHPHSFRHAFAAHSTRHGLDVFTLSRILGHSSISTTAIYLRSLGIEHLQDAHAKFSPLSRLG